MHASVCIKEREKETGMLTERARERERESVYMGERWKETGNTRPKIICTTRNMKLFRDFKITDIFIKKISATLKISDSIKFQKSLKITKCNNNFNVRNWENDVVSRKKC